MLLIGEWSFVRYKSEITCPKNFLFVLPTPSKRLETLPAGTKLYANLRRLKPITSTSGRPTAVPVCLSVFGVCSFVLPCCCRGVFSRHKKLPPTDPKGKGTIHLTTTMVDPNASVRAPELTLVAEDRLPALSKKPYGQDMRQAALLIALGGQADNALVQKLRATGRWPSERTVRRWQRQLQQTRSVAPYRHTGNKRSDVLWGEDLLLLAFSVPPTQSRHMLRSLHSSGMHGDSTNNPNDSTGLHKYQRRRLNLECRGRKDQQRHSRPTSLSMSLLDQPSG